jgi:hypothetical protein
MVNNLEKKVEQEVTKDILTAFPYFGTALNESKNMKKEEAYNYVSSAVSLVAKNSNDKYTKFLVEGLGVLVNNDFAENGTLTNTTYKCLESYAGLYNQKLEKASLSELMASAKDLGYKGKFPEFMNPYMKETLKSIKEIKNLNKEQLGILGAAFQNVVGLIYQKADVNIKEVSTERNFEMMQKLYEEVSKPKTDEKNPENKQEPMAA